MNIKENNKTLLFASVGIISIIIVALVFNIVMDWSKEEFAVSETVDKIKVESVPDVTDTNSYISFTSDLIGISLTINDQNYRIPTKVIVNEGTITYTVSKDGYVTKESSIAVYKGYITSVDVKMEAIKEENLPTQTATSVSTATSIATSTATVISTTVPTPIATQANNVPFVGVPVQLKFVSVLHGVTSQSNGYVSNLDAMYQKKLYLINAPLELTQKSNAPDGTGNINIAYSTKTYSDYKTNDFEHQELYGQPINYDVQSPYIIGNRRTGTVLAPSQSSMVYEIPVMPRKYGFVFNIGNAVDGFPRIVETIPVAYEVTGFLKLASFLDEPKYQIYTSSTTNFIGNASYTVYQWMLLQEEPINYAHVVISADTLKIPNPDFPGSKTSYVKIVDVENSNSITYKLTYDVEPWGIETIRITTI